MRTFIAITLLSILFPVSGLSQTKPTLPTGWRSAANSDYPAEDLSFLKNQAPSQVEADFNGDGLNDIAWILLKRNENQFGLFVFLGKRDGGFNLINLIKYQKETDKLYMGISLMTPGKYKTACGKGYGRCGPDEPKTIEFENPGINFFAFESANSVFYWHSKDKEFKRVWLSD